MPKSVNEEPFRYKKDIFSDQTSWFLGPRRSIKIEAMSSKDRVYINIDGFPTYESSSSSDRGVHMVILNQVTGAVMARRVFDTYLDLQEKEMVKFMQNVMDGRIIVCMIKVGPLSITCFLFKK